MPYPTRSRPTTRQVRSRGTAGFGRGGPRGTSGIRRARPQAKPGDPVGMSSLCCFGGGVICFLLALTSFTHGVTSGNLVGGVLAPAPSPC